MHSRGSWQPVGTDRLRNALQKFVIPCSVIEKPETAETIADWCIF